MFSYIQPDSTSPMKADGGRFNVAAMGSTGRGPSHDMNNYLRRQMAQAIFSFLWNTKDCPLNSRDLQQVAARLEEMLFKEAASQDEYMNLSTLSSRIKNLIKRSADQAAKKSSLSVPVYLARPDASRLPFDYSKGHTVGHCAVPSNNNSQWSSTPGPVGLHTDVLAGRGTYIDCYSGGHDLLSVSSSKAIGSVPFVSLEGTPGSTIRWDKNVHARSYDGVTFPPSNPYISHPASSQGHGFITKNQQCHNRQGPNSFWQGGMLCTSIEQNIHSELPSNQCMSVYPQNSAALQDFPIATSLFTGSLAGQGQPADVHSKGHDQSSAPFPKKRRPSSANYGIATDPFHSPEVIPRSSKYWDKSLKDGSFDGVGLPWGYPHNIYGASSQGHAIASKNLQRNYLRPLSSVDQYTLQSTHHELPSNQSPLNTVAPKVSSTCSGSGVPAVSYPSHQEGVQKVNWQVRTPHLESGGRCSTHDDTEVMLPRKRLKQDDQFGCFSFRNEIPPSEKLPKLQQYPGSPVPIDSQSPEPVAKDTQQYCAINGVLENVIKHNYEREHGNDVSPLEEIYPASSNRGAVDNNQNEAVADSCKWGSGGMVSLFDERAVGCEDGEQVMEVIPKLSLDTMDNNQIEAVADSCHLGYGGMVSMFEEPALGCEDGEEVMEDAPNPSLDTAYCPSVEVTVAPNMDNIDLMNQDLATDEVPVDYCKSRSDPADLNTCSDEERQIIEPINNISVPERALSGAIFEEVLEVTASKGGKSTGVSLIEYFTSEQIVDHLSGLGEWSSQVMPDDRGMDAAHKPSESLCQLCGQKDLPFAPAAMDCSSCYRIIKPDTDYFTVDKCEQLYFCSKKCGKNVKGKVDLVKKRHSERMVEPWVQCDSCRGWQHQICGLYNKEKDPAEKAEYTCPICCLKVIDSDDRMTFGNGNIFTAKDLPPTKLSDHIEKRLCDRLKQEREDRARASGKDFDKVPQAEGLVVRVVSSLAKKVEVNKLFLDIFRHENYPSEFPYKSKVIALFQKIGGVDVFLFGMYVQEYGTECSQPNKRLIYISYLDSVKYFHPDIKSAYEVNLRSFVYHEILIGYLDYCKQRGFVGCYLWACPPVKGDDYLFYCHPEFQKNLPRRLLLRWYYQLFGRATDEKVVHSRTNFYDHHWSSSRRAKFNVTAARLPYFEGDHWTSRLDKILESINKKPEGELEKAVSKRALKESKNTKDALLMHKIEQTMPDKEEFMIAHLQDICTACHEIILSGKRWFCNLCKKFQLCERCVDSGEECRTSNGAPVCREQHLLSQATVDSIPEDTEDGDRTVENQLFENRHSFLEFCKKNYYQFDTLRRAKHSSMMILHHLHESMNTSDGELVDQEDISHCHEMTPASSAEEPVPEASPKKSGSMYIKDLMNLLLHCSQCIPPKGQGCSFPNCFKVKWLFRHAARCSLRGSPQGCECRNLRVLLKLHVQFCKASDCKVPLCREMKSRLAMQPREPRTKGSEGS